MLRTTQRRVFTGLRSRCNLSKSCQKRYFTPAPRPGDGPLLSRRADRELPGMLPPTRLRLSLLQFSSMPCSLERNMNKIDLVGARANLEPNLQTSARYTFDGVDHSPSSSPSWQSAQSQSSTIKRCPLQSSPAPYTRSAPHPKRALFSATRYTSSTRSHGYTAR